MEKNEIIVYQPDNLTERIEVLIDKETVWLSLNQLSQLFGRDKSVISRHLKNIYKEGELLFESTVAKNATVQIEAGRSVKREIEYYNLDAIISVGYRVNSKQGTQFRIWATNVLREYLLRGYALNQRMNRVEDRVDDLSKKMDIMSLQIQASQLPDQGIFFNGQIFDAYSFVADLIRSANKSLILIDNYIDDTVFTLLNKRKKGVNCVCYTQSISKNLSLDLEKHNQQYPAIALKELKMVHDRFLIIDESELYHIGASLKDLGKKWFAFSKLNWDVEDIIRRIEVAGDNPEPETP
jgi:hypothetical protein